MFHKTLFITCFLWDVMTYLNPTFFIRHILFCKKKLRIQKMQGRRFLVRFKFIIFKTVFFISNKHAFILNFDQEVKN